MYHFIINPNSRSGLGLQVWNEVEAILKEKEVEYIPYFTKYQRHAIQIVNDITCDGEPHTLVVLGGDGTMGEVVTGIAYPEQVTIGYIPIGSGNDFARSLKISKDPAIALQNILDANTIKPLDVGVLEYKNKKRHFAVSSGIGVDAAVCHAVCVSKLKYILNKLKLGKFTYALLTIDRLFNSKPDKMTLLLDEKKELSFDKVHLAAAMNQPYQGGGCMFCPNAKSDDGTLDLIVIADIPKIMVLLILPTIFFGMHIYLKGVHIYRCKKVEITSEIPLAVHSDGEPIFLQRNLTYSVEPGFAKIILP